MNVGFRALFLLSVSYCLVACTNVLPSVKTLGIVPASVRVTLPVDGSYFNSTSSFQMSGACVTGNSVDISIDSVAAGSATCVNGSFTSNISLPVGDGPKVVEVSQTDATTSDVVTSQVTYNLDTVIPNVMITSPAFNFTSNLINGVSVVGTCEVGLPVTVTGTGVQTGGTVTCPGSGSYSMPIVFTAGEGAKDVRVEQTDRANNLGIATTTYNYALPVVNFSMASWSVPENVSGGLVELEVVLSGAVDGDVTIPYSVTGGTAAGGGVDYTLANGTVVIPGGQIAGTITLAINNDNISEPSETVVITLQNLSGANLGVNSQHTLTINDDEGTPTLQFSAATTTIAENLSGGVHSLTVVMSNPSATAVTVDYAVTGGTASGGTTDYTLANGTLNFAAGTVTRTLTIPIVNDTISEGAETIDLTLSNPTNATIAGNSMHIVTINDDDGLPLITFQDAIQNSNENGGLQNIAVRLSNASSTSVSVDYAVTGGTATGGGSDYSLVSGTIMFSPGQTSQNIAISLNDDNISEPTETVTVQLSNATANSTLGTPALQTHNIIDNDSTPTVQFAVAAESGSEGVTPQNITVELSNPKSVSTSVNYAVTGGTASGAGVDYTLASGVLNFAALEVSQDIALAVVDDLLAEGNETVIITLSSPTGLSLGTTTVHTHTITDDESAPQIEFQSATSNSLENVGSHTIPVVMSAQDGSAVTVNYSIGVGSTATGGGVDYTLVAGTLNFTAGQTVRDIVVPVVDDNLGEPNETLILNLSNVQGGIATLGTTTQHIYTIMASDAPSIQFATAASSVNENVGGLTHSLTVALSNAASTAISVNYEVDSMTPGTATGAGVDYTLVAGTLNFAAGETSKTFVIGLTNDTMNEGDETIQVSLNTPSGSSTIGVPGSHTVTIADDDPTPTVQFAAATSSAGENISPHTVAVTLSHSKSTTTYVNYVIAGGTAFGSGSDYTLNAGTLTFNPGVTSQNISIAIVDDLTTEGDETIELSLSSPSGVTLGSQTNHTHTIVDDEGAVQIEFSINSSSASESVGTHNMEVRLSGVSASSVTVEYAVNPSSTSTSGDDYGLGGGATLSFAAGVTLQTIPITITDDNIDEVDETLIIDLQNPNGAVIGTTASHTFTILDNDSAPNVQFATATGQDSEGTTTHNIVVTLSHPSSSPTSVNYVLQSGNVGTAANGSDYNLTFTTLSFAALETMKTISFTVVNDVLVEGDETINLELGSPAGLTLGSPATYTHTILDNDIVPFTWTGAGGNPNWSNSANWSSGVVPGAADTAIFNGACGMNCAVTVDQAVNIAGLQMDTGFASGSIDLGAANFNVANEFLLAEGVFYGGTGNVSVGNFLQTGGTFNFLNAATFYVNSDYVITTTSMGATNWDGDARIYFQSSAQTNISIDNNSDFDAVTVNKSGGATVIGAIIRARGDVNLTACGAVNTGLYLQGVVGTQTLTGTSSCSLNYLEVGATGNVVFNGDIHLHGNYQYQTAASFSATGSTLYFSSNVATTIRPGSVFYENVTIEKTGVVVTLADNALNVNGALSLVSSTSSTLSGTNINVAGNISASGSWSGSSVIHINGTGAQNISAGTYPNITVNKSGGTLTFAATISLLGNFTYTAGTVNMGAYGLSLTGSTSSTVTSSGSLSINTLTVAKSGTGGVAFSGTVNAGALTISGTSTAILQSGTVNVAGNLTHSNGTGGSAVVNLNGAGDQSITTSAGTFGWDLTVSKSTGVVYPASNITMASRAVTLSGTSVVRQNHSGVYNWSGISALTLGAGTRWVRGCATLGYSSLSGTGTLVQGNEVQLSINNPTAVTEGSNVVFTVTASPVNCVDTVLAWSTANGSALSGSDYTAVTSGSATIPASASTVNLSVTTLNDTYMELAETFTATITSSHTGATIGTGTGTGTISANGTSPTLSISSSTGNVSESAGSHPVVVVLTNPTYNNVTFTYNTSNGTATSGSDYTATSGTGTVLAGQTTATISVPILSDSVYEGAQYFNYSISSSATAWHSGVSGINAQVITINDDDSAPAIRFTASGSTATESTSSVVVTIEKVGNNTEQAIEFSLATTGSTATGSGTDYSLTGGAAVSMAAGAASVTKTIVLAGVSAGAEPDETVILTIPNSFTYNNATVGSPASYTLTIQDQTPAILSVDSPTVNDVYSNGDPAVSITVNFSQAVNVTGGSPTLTLSALSSTAVARTATYVSGSGTATLNFSYTISEGDVATDLNVTTFNLNGSTVRASAAPNADADVSTFGTTLATNKNIRINPRPRILAHTCMVDAYAGESYLGCSFSADRVNDTGVIGSDTGAQFSTTAAHTCSWFTIGASGTIGTNGLPTGTPTTIPAVTDEYCTIGVRVSDGYHNSTDYAVPVRVQGNTGFATVAQSGFHACALIDGRLKCWGTQTGYALGDGDVPSGNYSNYVIPRVASAGAMLSGVTDVRVGGTPSLASDGFTCARLSSGYLSCWGRNNSGQTGIGNTATPVAYASDDVLSSGNPLAGVMSYDLGSNSACAVVQSATVSQTGQVMCWGAGNSGQIGDGNSVTSQSTAVNVERPDSVAISGAVQVSVGNAYACAVMGTGGIKCWGNNSNGKLGIGESGGTYSSAQDVQGYDSSYRAVKVATGNDHACAIATNGRLKCWGLNSYGQLGDGSTTSRFSPSVVGEIDFGASNGDRIVDVSLGAVGGCALFDSGSNKYTKCWGGNLEGLLGYELATATNLGDAAGEVSVLNAVNLGSGLETYALSVGRTAVCAIVGSAGIRTGVKCWGPNQNGQLGDGQIAPFIDRGSTVGTMGTNLPYTALWPKVYVSSNTVAANAVLSAGDSMCQSDAFDHPARFHAMPLVSTASLNMRDLYTSTIPLKRPDGQIVSTNWTSMFDGTLDYPILQMFDGTSASNHAWTGSTSSGTASNSCNSWTDNTNSFIAMGGSVTSNTGGNWTTAASLSCDSTTVRIYCLLP